MAWTEWRTPRRFGGAGRALAFALLLLGLTVSWALAGHLQDTEDRHFADAMDRRAEAVRSSITNEAQRYEDTLRHLATALGAQQDLTAADFTVITSSLTQEGLPGASGVSLMVPVKPGQVAATQAFWRSQGNPGLTLHPAPGVAEHRFGVLSQRLDGSEGGSTGLDATVTSPEVSRAADLARETGNVAATETYVLRRDRQLPANERQQSFALVAPVYGLDQTRFTGWVVMGMRTGDFLNQSLREVAQGTVNISLHDANRRQDGPVAALHNGPALDRSGLDRTAQVTVGQRQWVLQMRATASLLPGGPSRQPQVAFAAGSLISVLLAGLILSLVSSHDRAVTKVEHATRVLREDIEHRKAIETELRQREAELQGFAAVAAHDLKSPLASLTAFAELLRADHGDLLSEEGLGDLQRIQENAYRMQTLIDELLAYATARDARLNLAPADLRQIAADIAAERRAYPGEHPPQIRVGALPTVTADPVMMRQLLDNLIGNACKYTHPGRAPWVDVAAIRIEDDWRVEVTDRGIGIPPEQRALVFGSFTRAKGSENYPGTGLGLAICQRIVERHDGSIGVEENPDGGSRFYFTLPVRQEQAEALPTGRTLHPVRSPSA